MQPIFKQKGSHSDSAFYRPIALLPCVSKVFESIVHEQLLAHCFKVDCIPDEQFGFLPKRSAVWQLLAFLSDWECALDNGYCVHACFLDMAKAFDRVDHATLLRKLASVGVRGQALMWFTSYLTGRRICTTVDGVRSSLRPISSGVPQGSVLGPLLFLLFYRDLPSVASSSCAMFADDTLMYDSSCSGSVTQPCCRLAPDLLILGRWATDWSTSFNASKSSHMLVRRQHGVISSPELVLDSTAIPAVPCAVHLGVHLSSLSWSAHVAALLQRVRFKVYMLRRLAYRLGSADVVKRLYRVW